MRIVSARGATALHACYDNQGEGCCKVLLHKACDIGVWTAAAASPPPPPPPPRCSLPQSKNTLGCYSNFQAASRHWWSRVM